MIHTNTCLDSRCLKDPAFAATSAMHNDLENWKLALGDIVLLARLFIRTPSLNGTNHLKIAIRLASRDTFRLNTSATGLFLNGDWFWCRDLGGVL